MKTLILTTSLESKTLDHVKIASFKAEDNLALGQAWLEIWVIIDYLETPGQANYGMNSFQIIRLPVHVARTSSAG